MFISAKNIILRLCVQSQIKFAIVIKYVWTYSRRSKTRDKFWCRCFFWQEIKFFSISKFFNGILKIVFLKSIFDLSVLFVSESEYTLNFRMIKDFQINKMSVLVISKNQLNCVDLIRWFVPSYEWGRIVVETIWCVRRHLVVSISIEDKAHIEVPFGKRGMSIHSFHNTHHNKVNRFLKTLCLNPFK